MTTNSGRALAFLILLHTANAHAAQVPADTTLPACYPRTVVEAVFGQKPAELAPTLAASLDEMKTSGKGGALALADYYLLTAHTYAQVPGKSAEAAKYYRLAAAQLGSADFLPKGVEDPVAIATAHEKPEADHLQKLWDAWHAESKELEQLDLFKAYYEESARQKRNKDAIPRLQAAVERMKVWAGLRRTWTYYMELGISGDDAESRKKGEELLTAIGDTSLAATRPWLAPSSSGSRQSGTAQVTLEPWYPEQTDKKLNYELPFLYKTQTFGLTVKNSGTAPIEFSSDDIVLSAATAGTLAALPVGELGPDVLANGMSLQQFMYPELTPYTFSNLSATEFNETQIELNGKLAEQQWSADWQERMDSHERAAIRERAERAAAMSQAFGDASHSMLNGINAADARHDQQLASQARSAHAYNTANLYENRARWELDNIKQGDESRKRWKESMQADINAIGSGDAPVPAGMVKTMDGVMVAITPAAWEESASDRLTKLEAKITLRLASKKLERFLNSDSVLPHQGTNLRIEPGQSWTGLVSFNTQSGGFDSLKLTLHESGAARSLSFPLAEKAIWIVKPPYLNYQPPIMIMSAREFGTASVMKAVDWKLIVPDLVHQQ